MSKKMNTNWRKFDAAEGAKGKVLRQNCTTRAISYALGMEYDKVFEMQKKVNAEVKDWLFLARYISYYNSTCISDKILTDNGYVGFTCSAGMKIGDIAKKVARNKFPIVVETSGHLTIMDKGEVVDTWDSTGRYSKVVWVKGDEDFELMKIANDTECDCWMKNGIEYSWAFAEHMVERAKVKFGKKAA